MRCLKEATPLFSLFTCKVLALLKEAGDQFRCAQKLLGRPVCQRAFRRLLGIGSMRYTRLKKAASEGLAQAPLDGRKVSKKNTFKSNTAYLRKRAIIVEFLEEMRNSISEPLPEANQNPKLLDEQKRSLTLFRRHRGRRPRGASQWSRGGDRSSLRLLPPGSFTDYLRLLQSRWPDLKISLKLFTRVPCLQVVQEHKSNCLTINIFSIYVIENIVFSVQGPFFQGRTKRLRFHTRFRAHLLQIHWLSARSRSMQSVRFASSTN